MADSIRLTALKNLQAQIRTIQGGNDGYFVTYSDVVLGPLTTQEAGRKRAMCGIVPGKEIKITEFPLTMCQLPLQVEFRATWNVGDPPSQEMAELMLADLQRKVLSDQSLGGIVIDCKDMGNEITLDIFSDKTITGVAYFDLLYRHATLDPTQPI